MHRWTSQAVESITNLKLLKRFRKLNLASVNYASLTEKQRQEWARVVLEFLTEVTSLEEGVVKAELTPFVNRSASRLKGQGVVVEKSIDLPVTAIRGISSTLATKFNKLGLGTVRDLLYFFPHRHLDYSRRKYISQLSEGEEETIIATGGYSFSPAAPSICRRGDIGRRMTWRRFKKYPKL